MAAWARPTARAVPWSSLAAAAAGLLGLVLVVAVTDAPPLPGSVAAVGAALLVAALAVCLHDPAHALLAALPTSPRRRTARRLALVLPVTAGVGALAAAVADRAHAFASDRPSLLAAALVLLAAALAARSALARTRPALAGSGAAAVPLAWAVLAAATPVGAAADVVAVWARPGWPLVAAALAAVALVAHER